MPKEQLPGDDGGEDPWEITRPGARTGRGTESLVPYLSNQRDTGPAELLPSTPAEKTPRSLMERVRWVLRER